MALLIDAEGHDDGVAADLDAAGEHRQQPQLPQVAGAQLEVDRAREAEFAARAADPGELVAALGHLSEDIDSALGALPPSSLERRILPPQHLWGTGQPREISAREAIVESIRHAAIHLGELRLTRDLQQAEARRAMA